MTSTVGKFLLDTNIVIALFGDDRKVKNRLSKVAQVFIPAIVLGELYFGAQKSQQADRNISRIRELAASVNVLSCNAITAIHYGSVKNYLKQKGRPIPENDIWIAATALQHGLVLVSRDYHFIDIEGLKVDTW